MASIGTLNINGLNNKTKQIQLIDFMKQNRIDILLLQEHNLKDSDSIGRELKDNYFISINNAICNKGGTAILINRYLPYTIISEEKSADSRILSMKLKIYNQFLHIVNVYAHAGNRSSERDILFKNELIFYLRNNLQNTFIGGDWNCVLSERDTSSENTMVSKSLLHVVRNFSLKDVWFAKNKSCEYTYFRNNYGSRIDRAYVKDLFSNITDVKTLNVYFSDHMCVKTVFDFKDMPKKGFGHWKLNTQLLEDEGIKNSFKLEWRKYCLNIKFYKDINSWWDTYAKKEIKFFFIKKGKELAKKKYGLIQFLEEDLNQLYNEMNTNGNIQYNEIKRLKDRIDELKSEILEGVKIRCRLKEQMEGERVSSFLMKEQTGVNPRKLITSIKTEEGIVENLKADILLDTKDGISFYIRKYYEKLYTKEIQKY